MAYYRNMLYPAEVLIVHGGKPYGNYWEELDDDQIAAYEATKPIPPAPKSHAMQLVEAIKADPAALALLKGEMTK